MIPKELTSEEKRTVLRQLDSTYQHDFVVRTDNCLNKHIGSYFGSQEDAKSVFNHYMSNFLELNRDLRTD